MGDLDQPTHVTVRATYSYDDVEAAMCVWEWLFTVSDNKPAKDATEQLIFDLFEQFGTGGMRSSAVQAATIIEGWWSYTQQNELPCDIGSEPFDWEFVPAACRLIDWRHLVEDNQYHAGTYRGQTAEAAIAAMIAMKAIAA